MQVRLQDLLGRRVIDGRGRSVGRIEEVLVRREQGALVVTEYRLGAYAFIERLAGGSMWRALLALAPFTRPRMLRVPWDRLDLSDPARPRLRGDPAAAAPSRRRRSAS